MGAPLYNCTQTVPAQSTALLTACIMHLEGGRIYYSGAPRCGLQEMLHTCQLSHQQHVAGLRASGPVVWVAHSSCPAPRPREHEHLTQTQ